MKLTSDISGVRSAVANVRAAGGAVGFVPTMGFLHDGHLSLVDAARRETDFVVVSIFVNPLQFAPSEDLDDYPRDIEKDTALLVAGGCDLLYVPRASALYPEEFCTSVVVKGLTETLCGAHRHGHFEGVATVVCKLLNIVAPDRAYFGEKDRQQLIVVNRMVRDLDMPVEIVGMPIVREKDGLAMSSRNRYLSEDERKRARCLSESLKIARDLIYNGEENTGIIIERMRNYIREAAGVEAEYIAAVDGSTLKPVSRVKEGTVFAVAARFGKARLIDNMQVGRPDSK